MDLNAEAQNLRPKKHQTRKLRLRIREERDWIPSGPSQKTAEGYTNRRRRNASLEPPPPRFFLVFASPPVSELGACRR
eukprot:scaffold1085_cov252-Pinguiococcus_pyrenoidosus.AAC.17